MESTQQKQQQSHPHAVCIPFPSQGHINPMLNLSILLHHIKGFHITFVNTEYNHNRLLKSRGPAALQGLPGFQFVTIPDGLSSGKEDGESTQNIPSLCLSTSKNCLAPVNELIDKLNSTPDVPPVSCVITDAVMSFGLDAAERIGVPGVLLRPASASSFMCDKHLSHLVEQGLVPIKDESYLSNGHLDTPIDWVPGMIPLRLKDFPSFSQSTDPNNIMLNFLMEETFRASKASAIIIHTFEELERDVLNALSTMCSPIYPIGPLHELFNQMVPETNSLKMMSSSLWKEEPECIKWLDSKPQSSVIYVNFGSIAVLTAQQLNELALGLADSKKYFLWVVRPDMVSGENAALPHKYWEDIGDRGFIAGWCSQGKVLNHPAVGGFLTHCGWNSTLESLCSGVPMLCWPFSADQHINCRYACDVWGVGVKIEKDVKRDEVGILVNELLDGEKGKLMKKRAIEWKKKAAEAIANAGSSYLNLDRVVQQVLAV